VPIQRPLRGVDGKYPVIGGGKHRSLTSPESYQDYQVGVLSTVKAAVVSHSFVRPVTLAGVRGANELYQKWQTLKISLGSMRKLGQN
jgi:hypothetical protein